MTKDENGKVLPECSKNMALLQAAERSLSTSVAEMGQQVNTFRSTVIEQTVKVDGLKQTLNEEVLPVIRNLPIDMANAIKSSQENCPLYSQLNKKRDDTVKRLLISKPPKEPPKKRSKVPVWVKSYLLQAIAALLFSIAMALGGYYVGQPSNGHVMVQVNGE